MIPSAPVCFPKPRLPNGGAIILCLSLLAACAETPAAFDPPRIRFTADGADLTFSQEASARVVIIDSAGQTVLDTGIQAASPRIRRLPFQWLEGHTYEFQFESTQGVRRSVAATAPENREFHPRLSLYMPYLGKAESPEASPDAPSTVSAIAGSRAELTLVIVNQQDVPLRCRISLRVPDGLSESDSAEVRIFEPELSRSGERWFETVPLAVAGDEQTHQVVAMTNWAQGGERWQTETILNVIPRRPETLRSEIEIGDIRFPANVFGDSETGVRGDAYVLPSDFFGRMRSLFGLREVRAQAWIPAAYESVSLEYTGDVAAGLLVESRIVNPLTGAPAPGLSPPALLSGGRDVSLGFVMASPGQVVRAVLPVFVDANQVLPGRYVRRIRIKPWGADVILSETARPLEIVRPSPVSVTVVAFALLSAFALVAFLLLGGNAFLGHFKTRELILISLFATILFSAVTLPLTVAGSILTGIMGPFAFLVTGLLGEAAYYALVIAFLTLIPRVGALTALTAVRLLLSAILLGQVTLPSLLYTASHLLILETACYLSGLTRGGRLQAVAAGRLIGLWGAAICLGAADGFSNWIDFQITIQLYRLYFADWYIALNVIVHGFVYTVAGVHLGARLGRSLGRTAP